jgi:DUF4097 and DUF4098 domain-containing protein YvlB
MPTFSTPEPIHVILDLAAGDARLSAEDRRDTVVEVVPRDPSRRADVRTAEQTRVELSDGRLVVRTPRQGLSLTKGGAVDVTIALPAGSRVEGHTGAGELRADGTLADCDFKSGVGAIRLGTTGALRVASGAGDIAVERAAGDVTVKTGSGAVQVGHVGQHAVIKNGNGTTTLGDVGGDVRITAANGDIAVGRAGRSVVAKTANGSVRVGEVAEGSVELNTAYGNLEVGVAEGTAARLDVRTHFGAVRRELEATDAPPPSAPTVTIRGRTAYGDIVIRRP